MVNAYLPVSEGGNKVKATVHPVIDDVPSVQTALIMQVPFKLLIDVGDDCLKAGRNTNTTNHGIQEAAVPNFKGKTSCSIPCLSSRCDLIIQL